jgi:hypothetical protein
MKAVTDELTRGSAEWLVTARRATGCMRVRSLSLAGTVRCSGLTPSIKKSLGNRCARNTPRTD